MSGWLALTVDVVCILVSILLLWRGADRVVDSAARIARHWNVSELVIGLTLVAFATSAPELAVSVGAALTGRADISVGNVIGSNTFNLGFILGGCAAIRPIMTSRPMVYRDGIFLFLVTLMLAWSIYDLEVSRLEGGLMLGLLAAYIAFLFFRKASFEQEDESDAAAKVTTSVGSDLFHLVLGILLVVGGAQLLVHGASGVARAMGVSDWAIAVTIVAAGTSAPEVVTSLNAAVKAKHGISAGGLIGSDIYNLLGVLGLAALIHPMEVAGSAKESVFVLIFMVGTVLVMLRSGWRLSRIEGALLVLFNAFRWWTDMSGAGG